MPEAGHSNTLLHELERLVNAGGEADTFNAFLNVDSLPRDERKIARLVNRILTAYRDGGGNREAEQQARLQSILNGMDAFIYVCDAETFEIFFLNDSIREHLGIEGDGVGQLCHKLLQGVDEPCAACPWRQLHAEPDTIIVWEHRERKKGALLRKMARFIDWPGGRKAHLEYAVDITELRETQEVVRQLEVEVNKIFYDPLTSIHSRHFFEENIERLIASLSRAASTLSIMMIDIDYFKQYNDTYGHIQGDDCLKTIAETLQRCITRNDDFIARYGGEEFVAVLPNTDEDGARRIAEKMLACVRNDNMPHAKSAVAECVTISIGVVSGKVKHTHRRNDYLSLADEMLYTSKHGGRNRYSLATL